MKVSIQEVDNKIDSPKKSDNQIIVNKVLNAIQISYPDSKDMIKSEINEEKSFLPEYKKSQGNYSLEKSFDFDNDENEGNEEKEERETLIISKYFYTCSKKQNALYEQYLSNLNSLSWKQDRIMLIVLWSIFIIRSLISISWRKFYDNIFVVFFFRGVFNILLMFSIKHTRNVLNLSKKSYSIKFTILGIYTFGILASLIEIVNSNISEDYSLNILEILLNFLIHSNLW